MQRGKAKTGMSKRNTVNGNERHLVMSYASGAN